MNRDIHPPIHSEAHRRLKDEALRRAHAMRGDAVNGAMDDAVRALGRWLARAGGRPVPPVRPTLAGTAR